MTVFVSPIANGVILCRNISVKLSYRDNFNSLIFRDRFSKSAFFAPSERNNLVTLKVFNQLCCNFQHLLLTCLQAKW